MYDVVGVSVLSDVTDDSVLSEPLEPLDALSDVGDCDRLDENVNPSSWHMPWNIDCGSLIRCDGVSNSQICPDSSTITLKNKGIK